MFMDLAITEVSISKVKNSFAIKYISLKFSTLLTAVSF